MVKPKVRLRKHDRERLYLESRVRRLISVSKENLSEKQYAELVTRINAVESYPEAVLLVAEYTLEMIRNRKEYEENDSGGTA